MRRPSPNTDPARSRRFQLPLSGSHQVAREHRRCRCDQAGAFNSLARDHMAIVELEHREMIEEKLSTPSLGITSVEKMKPNDIVVILTDFQLPLSGSLATLPRHSRRERDFQLPLSGSPQPCRGLLRRSPPCFQLPLSGSPSPIPGFFGSPRRSAAATLRTNES